MASPPRQIPSPPPQERSPSIELSVDSGTHEPLLTFSPLSLSEWIVDSDGVEPIPDEDTSEEEEGLLQEGPRVNNEESSPEENVSGEDEFQPPEGPPH